MKYYLTLLLGVLLFSIPFRGSSYAEEDESRYYNFKVVIKGFTKQAGMARMALYNKRLFLNKKQVVRANAVPIESDTCLWILNKIDPGEYAIVVYHDLNNNNKLDKSFFGKAKEPYAFSGSPHEKSRKAPKFEEVSFQVNENLKTLVITLPPADN